MAAPVPSRAGRWPARRIPCGGVEDARIEAVITRTLESQPQDATHWSSRGMACDSGLSVSTVQRIERVFGLKPHRQETFKLSTDRDFIAKVRLVRNNYATHKTATVRNQPAHATVSGRKG
ncbi:MAG: hypothetical protein ACJ8AW_04910 [Rhodopila sp.]